MAFPVPIFSEGFGGSNAIMTLLFCLATLPRYAARWCQCSRSRSCHHMCIKIQVIKLRTTLISILVIWIHSQILDLQKYHYAKQKSVYFQNPWACRTLSHYHNPVLKEISRKSRICNPKITYQNKVSYDKNKTQSTLVHQYISTYICSLHFRGNVFAIS